MAIRTDYFRGRVAAISGAASGIGLALAEALADCGARLMLADIDADRLAATTEALDARARLEGGDAHGIVTDVRHRAQVRRWVDATLQAHGRLHFIFNNAGIERIKPTAAMTDADWDLMRATNIDGVYHGVQVALPIMLRQGFGHIVNTASVAGLIGTPGLVGYAMTKHAVVGLTTSLAPEVHDRGIRVHAICPGIIDTPMARRPLGDGLLADSELPGLADRLPGPELVARIVLTALPRGKVIIPVTRSAHLAHAITRLSPALMQWLLRRFFVPRMPFLRHDTHDTHDTHDKNDSASH